MAAAARDPADVVELQLEADASSDVPVQPAGLEQLANAAAAGS